MTSSAWICLWPIITKHSICEQQIAVNSIKKVMQKKRLTWWLVTGDNAKETIEVVDVPPHTYILTDHEVFNYTQR